MSSIYIGLKNGVVGFLCIPSAPALKGANRTGISARVPFRVRAAAREEPISSLMRVLDEIRVSSIAPPNLLKGEEFGLTC